MMTQGLTRLPLLRLLHTCPRVPALLSATTSMAATSSNSSNSSSNSTPKLRSFDEWSFDEPKLAQLPLDRWDTIFLDPASIGTNFFALLI